MSFIPSSHLYVALASKLLKLNGERGRNRTFNLLIKSQLLCQLSYAPLLWNQSDEGHHRKPYQCNTSFRRRRRGGQVLPNLPRHAIRRVTGFHTRLTVCSSRVKAAGVKTIA